MKIYQKKILIKNKFKKTQKEHAIKQNSLNNQN